MLYREYLSYTLLYSYEVEGFPPPVKIFTKENAKYEQTVEISFKLFTGKLSIMMYMPQRPTTYYYVMSMSYVSRYKKSLNE